MNNALTTKREVIGYSNRIVGLDVLRISLAVLIYMFHSWMHFGCSYSFLNDFVSVGAIAMTGFFLISGYALRLVYGNQDLMEKHNLGRFYLKRISGIIPLYYLLALTYIILCGKESLIRNLMLFPIEALGLQTTFTSLSKVTHNGGTWFISCILLAYLIFPFLQTVCKQLNAKTKVLLLLLLMFMDIWAPLIALKFHTATLYDNPFYRIVEFACGLLVADINMEYDNKFLNVMRSWGMLICSLVTLIVGVSLMRHYLLYDDYMLYNIIVLPCFALMLFGLGTLKVPFLERFNVIGYLGRISYAFFLVQFFAWIVGRWVIVGVGYNHNWFRILVSFIYCIVASIVVYEWIQKPISKCININFIKK